ncbi:MAG TPA: hypothetical protein VG204_12635 [Terriglobia bacterium]|nr:hypothetical protein [Terriglobia bacterium]
MSLTLTDQQVAELTTAATFLEGLISGQSSSQFGTPPVSWQDSLFAKARAWLNTPANAITADPTGSDVIAAFRAAFPQLQIQAQVLQVPAAAPGLPPTGQYHVYGSISMYPPPTAVPTPIPTVNADGTGIAGANPPPGVDSATLISTPAGAAQTGSDGVVYVKHLVQTMFGPSVYWMKQ